MQWFFDTVDEVMKKVSVHLLNKDPLSVQPVWIKDKQTKKYKLKYRVCSVSDNQQNNDSEKNYNSNNELMPDYIGISIKNIKNVFKPHKVKNEYVSKWKIYEDYVWKIIECMIDGQSVEEISLNIAMPIDFVCDVIIEQNLKPFNPNINVNMFI